MDTVLQRHQYLCPPFRREIMIERGPQRCGALLMGRSILTAWQSPYTARIRTNPGYLAADFSNLLLYSQAANCRAGKIPRNPWCCILRCRGKMMERSNCPPLLLFPGRKNFVAFTHALTATLSRINLRSFRFRSFDHVRGLWRPPRAQGRRQDDYRVFVRPSGSRSDHPPGWLHCCIREICDRHGGLMIADSPDNMKDRQPCSTPGIEPDIVTLAKGFKLGVPNPSCKPRV